MDSECDFYSLPVRFIYPHISEILIRAVKFIIRESNWINMKRFKMYNRALCIFRKYFVRPLWYAIIHIRVEQVVSVGAEYHDSMKVTAAYVYLFFLILLNILV